ncbi:MAG: hypothetical protein ACK5CY_02970 [Bacteroidia bacterium]|jgi:hypothetical protein
MEHDNKTSSPPKSKTNWGRIFFYLISLGIIVFLCVKLWQSENKKNALSQKLENQIKEQQKRLNSLDSLSQKQANLLKEYKPYQAVVRSAALRDSIYTLLPFKFGENVYIMPDSIKATINSVSINGNASEYSIKYLVRTKKGDYQSISISDLIKIQ